MKFKTLRRGDESGQALVEMTIGIIALACVFLGLVMVAVLGKCNIDGTLKAREAADAAAFNNASGSEGQSIIQWSLGADNMMMTADDTVSAGLGGDGSLYDEQLTAANIGSHIAPASTKVEMPASLSSSDLYVKAAELVSGDYTQNAPLADNNLPELQSAISSLMGVGSFKLTNAVYMPVLQNN